MIVSRDSLLLVGCVVLVAVVGALAYHSEHKFNANVLASQAQAGELGSPDTLLINPSTTNDLIYRPNQFIRTGDQAINDAAEAIHERAKRDRYFWYGLTDAQDTRLRAALKQFKTTRQIYVLSATPDSLELAEDFDMAFNDAGIVSKLERPADTVDGIHVTSPALADIIQRTTHIEVQVDPDEDPTAVDSPLVVNIGRKIVKK